MDPAQSDHDDSSGMPIPDPALRAEFEAVFEKVRETLNPRQFAEDGDPPQPTVRMVLDVPKEWFVLFAWMERRRFRRRHGKDGPTGLTPEFIEEHENRLRGRVRAYMLWVLNEHFHAELHELASGISHLWTPEPPRPAKPEGGDLDDGIPW